MFSYLDMHSYFETSGPNHFHFFLRGKTTGSGFWQFCLPADFFARQLRILNQQKCTMYMTKTRSHSAKRSSWESHVRCEFRQNCKPRLARNYPWCSAKNISIASAGLRSVRTMQLGLKRVPFFPAFFFFKTISPAGSWPITGGGGCDSQRQFTVF